MYAKSRANRLLSAACAALPALLLIPILFVSAARAQTALVEQPLGGGFSRPAGLFLDGSGNIYVVDGGNNEVYKMPVGCASASCVTTVNDGIYYASGVAADQAGDLFFSGYTGVFEMPAGCNSPSCVTHLGNGSAIFEPSDIAVDASGNVYVAAGAMFEMTPGCLTASCVTQLGGSGYPFKANGVAVDKSGNVYVSGSPNAYDTTFPVYEMSPNCLSTSCVTTLGGGFGGPSAIALDLNGDVYVADAGNHAVYEMPPGCASASCVTALGGGFPSPYGVAVDQRGNVYVGDYTSDTAGGQIHEIQRSVENLGSMEVNSGEPSTLTLTYYFLSSGTIGVPQVLTQGASGQDFTDAGTGTCTTNGTSYNYVGGPLTGATCTVVVNFNPKFPGTRDGAVVLANSSNQAIATTYMWGTGTAPQAVFNPASQTALGGGFNESYGVAVDGGGNVYVADQANNAVKEISPGCTSAGCVTTLGGGFSRPVGVAVDGAGNVYVASSASSAVTEMPPGCASASCETTLGGGFDLPIQVVADSNGNVYVADSGNNAIKEMPAGCASASCVTTLGGGFTLPYGVAVDGIRNIYVADTYAGLVKEMPPGCSSASCVTTLGGAFSYPVEIALDGGGNVYVAESGTGKVKEIPAGCISSSCVITLGGSFVVPDGVAVDGSGNVYVADSYANEVSELGRPTPPTVSFPATLLGQSSTPGTVTLANIGNDLLYLTTPSSGTNPLYPADFPENTADTSLCSSATPLSAGSSCDISADFTPLSTGVLSEAVTITDNSLNVTNAVQSIAVSGDGNLPQTISFSSLPGVTYGVSPITLSATATSSLGVTFKVDSGPASVNGNMLTITGAGTVVVEADQGGSTVYAAATPVQRSFNVAQATPAVTWHTPAAISTNTPLSATQLDASAAFAGASVPGVFVYTPASGALLAAGAQTLSVTFTPTDAVDYATVTKTASLQVYAAAALTAPTAGATLAGPSVAFTWAAAASATNYYLWIGSTGVGSNNLYNSAPKTTTSYTFASMPTNGETIYVRLITNYSGVWISNDYAYTAATAAVITAPVNSSTFSGTSVTFDWTAAAGATGYYLWIGSTGVGSNNLYNSALKTVTSFTFGGMPANGETVYVRLITNYSGAWVSSDYTYTTAVAAVITSPVSGSTLGGASVTFDWTPAASATSYYLWIGSTGVGSNNLYNSAPKTITSYTFSSMPTNGETIYVRLITNYNGVWVSRDYTYIAVSQAALTSPAANSTFTGSSVAFSWTAASGATGYYLWIGSTGVGSNNIYNSALKTVTTYTFNGIPTNGETIYVRLITNYSGTWVFNDYTFRAAVPAAPITSPAAGSTFSSPNVTFTWTPNSGATNYFLWIGSTGAGSNNIYNSASKTVSTYTFDGIPCNGETIYVRLITNYSGTWVSNDYTYTAALQGAITSPAAGSVLPGASVPFTWSPGSGVTSYYLQIGTTGVGSDDLYNSAPKTGTSYTFASMPTNGETIYVRLTSNFNGVWAHADYTYTAAATP